ncbi:MAG: dTDP-4-amino-4,6-dideoxygalactose transaminase [Bacteroidota bacterium]|nr:dTDP-4-amino-4,6-dideoxygalactose transaminase [Bacteroidota bacterium]
MKIPFNKPYFSGRETEYIAQAVKNCKISGDGVFTKKCHEFFKNRYGFKKCLLTTSCTDALEMAALLLNIQPGDEVIMPSFTFVSTANAFVLRGAKIVFVDSLSGHPNMDADAIESLITPKTRVIVPVHYAGVACDMEKIMQLAARYDLFVVEDAAQAIDSYFTDSNGISKPLGSIGHLSAFSFHETKNIISGEGGMLVINDDRFLKRSEIIWEKGTNRSAFFRGEVDKYGWVDIGSSFLPSDLIAAFLLAQLENIDRIQERRKAIWCYYERELKFLEKDGQAMLPKLPGQATNNAHMFYIIARDLETRKGLMKKLGAKNIDSVFHYQSLHKSPFYSALHSGTELPNCDQYTDRLLRLPMYFELTEENQSVIVEVLKSK